MKAKESQAQIKALEALVAAYSAKLKNVQTSASGEESSTSSHEGVIGIADSYGCLVHRAVINGENSIALVDESFSKICESFPVGWITRGNESGAFDSVIAHGECEEAAAGSQTAATESTVLESAAAALEGNKMLAEQLQKLNAEKAAKLKTRAAKVATFSCYHIVAVILCNSSCSCYVVSCTNSCKRFSLRRSCHKSLKE